MKRAHTVIGIVRSCDASAYSFAVRSALLPTQSRVVVTKRLWKQDHGQPSTSKNRHQVFSSSCRLESCASSLCDDLELIDQRNALIRVLMASVEYTVSGHDFQSCRERPSPSVGFRGCGKSVVALQKGGAFSPAAKRAPTPSAICGQRFSAASLAAVGPKN